MRTLMKYAIGIPISTKIAAGMRVPTAVFGIAAIRAKMRTAAPIRGRMPAETSWPALRVRVRR